MGWRPLENSGYWCYHLCAIDFSKFTPEQEKKVLLRERKRHTDRSVSSTPSVILYRWGVPPAGRGCPISMGIPHPWPGGTPAGGTPSVAWRGYPLFEHGWVTPHPGLDRRGSTPSLAEGYPGVPPSRPGQGTP